MFICAWLFNGCQSYQTINKDPKAKYYLAAETVGSVVRTLAHLRVTKVINNDNDWNRIKIIAKQTKDALGVWSDLVKNNGDTIDVEKIVTDGLNQLQEFHKTYE